MNENNQNTVIFAPAAEIKNIRQVIDNLKTVHTEFQKVAKAMNNLDTSLKTKKIDD